MVVSRRPTEALILADGDTVVAHVTVRGPPVSQPRPRARMLPRNRVVVFNPAAREKNSFQRGMREALTDLGVMTFPLFPEGARLHLKATFVVSNLRKDVDNMLKFVLDVLEGVLYRNDATVFSIQAQKASPADVGVTFEYTKIEVENLVPFLDEI